MTCKENVLCLIDPIDQPELYQEVKELITEYEEDIFGLTQEKTYLEREILEMMEAIEERNDEIEDLKNELLQYEDVIVK